MEKPMKYIKERLQEIHSIQAELIKKDYIIASLKWKNQDTKQIILHKRQDKSYK